MTNIEISCSISTTDADVPLGLEIWLDDRCVFDQAHITGNISWRHRMPDDDAEHALRWVLKNKTQEHTRIDDQGVILQDARLTVTDMRFDNMELGHIFVEKSTYRHDHNGTTELADHPFYGDMGCNGTVTMKFTTPLYLWLLENL